MDREDCSITLSSIKGKLYAEHNINVSLSTIHRLMREFIYFLKRVKLIPEKRSKLAK